MSHDPYTTEGTARVVADLMKEIGPHEPIATPLDANDGCKTHLIAVPAGRSVHDITAQIRANVEYLKPARRQGTARVADLASLILWANRFKGATSALFASPDLTKPALTCIADYHGEGSADPTNGKDDPTARHCRHRAIYDFPLSEEWKAWTGLADTALTKDELGEFIEAHAFDIMDPTPAIIQGKADKAEAWEARLIQTAQKIEGRFAQLSTLLELSRKFQVYETSNLTAKTNRDTGEAEIQFTNEHNAADGQPLKIPNLLIIAIPVFQGGQPYRMTVRFRYRKNGSDLKFLLSVFNPEKAFESAFNEAVDAATEATGLPTFRGTPEA